MDVHAAQRQVRSVYIGGFWGQLVSSVIWLVSAALGTWVTPKASILAVVIGGFFIFPLTQMLLRLSGRPRLREHRESVPFPRDAGRVCAAVFDVASCARRLLPLELVFPSPDGPSGRPLFAFCYPLRNAHIPVPRGTSDRYGRRYRTIFCGNIQPWRMGLRTGPVRLRVDWALHCDRRSR
jgi:hypothetical protein